MENTRKRQSSQPVEDMVAEANVRPGSPTKRQRTSSNAGKEIVIDPTLLQRFKQPDHLLGPQICSLCERNITKSVKILCADCGLVAPANHLDAAKSELYMCLECLRLGKESETYPMHKNNHAYYVFDNLDFPLLTIDWSAL